MVRDGKKCYMPLHGNFLENNSMLPVTDADLLTGITSIRVSDKLFAHRAVPEGTRVAVRLNLNCRIRKNGISYSIQTVHSKPSPKSRALGYDVAVTIRDADFMVDQKARAAIATGREHKMPMAAVIGKLSHTAPSLDGVELRFNPKTSHLFIRADDNRAVKSADEVTVFNTRAYARGNITYWDTHDAPEALESIETDAKIQCK